MSADADSETLVTGAPTSVVRPRLFTIAEAAVVLNVPENWLRKKVTAGDVPHTRLGRHVRFTDAHLDQIIDNGEQQPVRVVTSNGVSRRARRAS
jgi:excisionase family DNA binding protein